MASKHDFQIEKLDGEKAKVINGGKQYTTYSDFAEAAGYPDSAANCRKGETEDKVVSAYSIEGHTVKLLAKGEHECKHTTLYIAETEVGDRFIIGEQGIEILPPVTLEDADTDELLAELKRRLAGKVQTKVVANITLDGKDIAETIMDRMSEPMPTRESIVQQAKDDVDELKRPGSLYGDSWEYRQHLDGYDEDCGRGSGMAYNAEFIINRDKRTVAVLLRGYSSGDVLKRGIAKCDPNDCFNEYIGKAIALRRALGLDVPSEYLNAREPEGKQAGDVVEYSHGMERIYRLIPDSEYAVPGSGAATLSSFVGKEGTVIDDSARYKA